MGGEREGGSRWELKRTFGTQTTAVGLVGEGRIGESVVASKPMTVTHRDILQICAMSARMTSRRFRSGDAQVNDAGYPGVDQIPLLRAGAKELTPFADDATA